jgi:hypothetical protein
MTVIAEARDRDGRGVVLDEHGWAHILEEHGEMATHPRRRDRDGQRSPTIADPTLGPPASASTVARWAPAAGCWQS